jgi:uncharacterized protein YecT (DUF1311 family)
MSRRMSRIKMHWWMNWLLSIAVCHGVLFIQPAQAASFDCNKAQSKVEHLIWDNPELSKLDDEMAVRYKEVLQDKGTTEAIKHAQRLWLEVRNGCDGVECLTNAYITRHSSPPQPAPTLAAKFQAQQILQINEKSLYAHCADVDGRWGCETGHMAKTGKGYAVCESYLKHLNAVPEISKCEAPVPPGFKQPEWQDLDIASHLQLAHQAEALYFVGRGGYKHPDFEIWKQQFMTDLQARIIAPQLRKTTVQPFGEKAITLLAYTRDREGCVNEVWRKNLSWGDSGYVYFLLADDSQELLRAIKNRISRRQSELLVYAGSPYFVLRSFTGNEVAIIAFDKTMTYISARVATMDAFYDKFRGSKPTNVPKEFDPDPNVNWAGQLCHFVPIKPPRR